MKQSPLDSFEIVKLKHVFQQKLLIKLDINLKERKEERKPVQ